MGDKKLFFVFQWRPMSAAGGAYDCVCVYEDAQRAVNRFDRNMPGRGHGHIAVIHGEKLRIVAMYQAMNDMFEVYPHDGYFGFTEAAEKLNESAPF